MADQVLHVNIAATKDNPAAITAKMAELMKTKYFSVPRQEKATPFGIIVLFPGVEWMAQGPNFIKEKYSGRVVNLNQEAVDSLQAAPPRQDVVAVVQDDSGSTRNIYVDQSALHAAGGDLNVLKQNLQQVLAPAEAAISSPANHGWIIFGAVAGIGCLYFLSRRGNH